MARVASEAAVITVLETLAAVDTVDAHVAAPADGLVSCLGVDAAHKGVIVFRVQGEASRAVKLQTILTAIHYARLRDIGFQMKKSTFQK